jgi:tight adherence protein C
MIILLIIGLGLTVVAVTLVLRAVNIARVRSAETIETIEAYGFSGRTESVLVKSGRNARTTVDDYVSRLGDLFARHISALSSEQARKDLVAAGLYTLTPRKFIGYRAISTIGVPALCFWMLALSSLPLPVILIAAGISVYAGWKVPILLVQTRARRRQTEIDTQLPELIDLLVVTVEAGIGFTGSLRIAGERIGGALGQELALVIQEQTMGLSSNEALANMLDRADTPGIRSFVRSILQGETLGVSIGQILRNLAIEMRKRRRALAEERAQKAPIKILFPLVFMIFPAIFVIILAPAIYSLVDALHK